METMEVLQQNVKQLFKALGEEVKCRQEQAQELANLRQELACVLTKLRDPERDEH